MGARMRKTSFWMVGAALCGAMAPAAFGAQVTSIDFKQLDDASEIRITANGPLDVSKSENGQDKQIVLDLKGATLSKGASRKLDTSSFKSKVSLISPYAVSGQGDSRVVIQLREPGSAVLSQEGNRVVVRISDTIGTSAAADEPSPPADTAAAESPVAPAAPAVEEVSAAPAVGGSAPAKPGDEVLSIFDESKRTQKYVGKPISLQVRDMDLVDVFQLIGEASGFNVIVGSEVNGKITMSLTDTPWDQVLDLVLQTRQLGAERRNNVLRITTLANLTAEKSAEMQAKRASEATAPRITRIFPISYAKLGDLVSTFKSFAAATNGNDPQAASIIQPDDRTNSIIVRDTAENVERFRKLIEILDTQTPQVLIEAKIVEANSQFSKAIGGAFGTSVLDSGDTNFIGGTSGASPTATLGASALVPPTAGGGAMGVSLGFIPGLSRVNALLTLSETEESAKTIASPRVVVLNKESAAITASSPGVIKTLVTTANGPQETTQTVPAPTTLSVSPTVTNDSSVLLTLNLQRDIVTGAGTIANRTMNTKVIVDSGNTLVIGGLYTEGESESERGVPYLRKIPILGTLFSNNTTQSNRAELFFFITPRILNAKESGLGSDGAAAAPGAG